MKLKTIAYFLLTVFVLYIVIKVIIKTEGFVEGHGGGGGGGHGGGGHGGGGHGGWGPHGGHGGRGHGGWGPWVWGGNGGTWNGYGYGWGWDLLPPQSQTVVYKPKKQNSNMGPIYFFLGIIAAILGGIFTMMFIK